MNKAGWIAGIGGSAAMIALGVGVGDTNGGLAYGIAGAGIVGSVTGGILLNKSGKRKIRQIVNSYNDSGVPYSYNANAPSICLSLSPAGIRLTF